MDALAITPFPELLEASRVYLQKHRSSMAPEMFHLIDLNRESLNPFMPWAEKTRSVKDSKAWILHTQEAWKEGSLFDYGLYLKGTRRYIGSLGLHTIEWDHRRAEFGYWLGKEFQGCGYLAEALTVLEKEAYQKGFHRLEIRCSTENTRSAQVARRAGYILEGTLKDNTLFSGRWVSNHIFAKLAK